MEISGTSYRTIACLAALMVAAVGIAFLFLPQSLRLDEAQSLWETSRTAGGILATVAEDVHVPLYHELLHAWLVVVGNTVTSARVFSLIFFVLSIPAIFMLGRLAYDTRLGLLAALLFTLSPFMNWYASEIRMYTLFMFIAILHQYFYLRLIKRETDYAWIGYALTTFVGMYVHYFFFLILFTEAIFFFLRRELFSARALRRFFSVWALAVVFMVPWGLYVIYKGQALNQQPVLPVPTTVNLFNVFAQFLFGFQIDPVNTVLLSLWPVVLVLAFLALRKNISGKVETGLFIFSLFLPVVLAFCISFIVPLFVSRYLIFVAPSLYILVAHIFSRYPKGIAWASFILLIVLMSTMMGMQLVSAQTPVKEDYRGATDYLAAHATPQDVIIVSAPFTIYPIEYYYHGSTPLYTLPYWNRYSRGAIPGFDESKLPSEVQIETQNTSNVWLLLSYDQGYEKKIKSYFDSHYAMVYSHTFSPDLALYEYRVRYAAEPSHVHIVPTPPATLNPTPTVIVPKPVASSTPSTPATSTPATTTPKTATSTPSKTATSTATTTPVKPKPKPRPRERQ